MAWTTPKTWEDGEIVDQDDLNTHIRDNLNYLKDRIDGDNAAQYATEVTANTQAETWTDVDGTNLNLTITTNGGDVAITIIGGAYNSGNLTRGVDIGVQVDGTTDYTIITRDNDFWGETGLGDSISCTYILSGLAAGSHSFKLRFKRTGAGGTAYIEVYQFDVRETMGVVA